MLLSAMRLVFFDIEATGLDPAKHQPIQLGAVAVHGETLEELAAFEVKIRFGRAEASLEALAKNSFDESAWEKESVSEHEAAKRFVSFLKEHATSKRETKNGKPFFVSELAGYNAAVFDGPFLHAWFERLGAFLPASFHVRCVLQKSLWFFFEHGLPSPPDWKLDTLCDAFGVELGEKAHDALADSRATAALYRALLGGAEPKRVARRTRESAPPRKQFSQRLTVRRRRRRSRAW